MKRSKPRKASKRQSQDCALVYMTDGSGYLLGGVASEPRSEGESILQRTIWDIIGSLY